ncbi:MAG: exonuclease SbcCD subunit D [Saccharofermentans sp.]|nr:exonuclease SbcCD subunit D [Saccharofermentans sp.]
MRFFHIADLHLGKYLKDSSLIEDQTDWVEKFLGECGIGEAGAGKEKPDAVAIAGDVFDSQDPPSEARMLLDRLITQLSKNGIAVLMIAGNHDIGGSIESARNFETHHELLALNNIHIAAVTNKVIKNIIVNGVCFWLLPYTDRIRIADAMGVESFADDTEAVKALLDAQEIDHSICNVILSHQNVVHNGKTVEPGGSESRSTGDRIGGVSPLEDSVFSGFDYVALGHIHSGMPVGGEDSVIKYAGTPLCYHLDETKYKKNKGYIEVVVEGKRIISKDHKHIEPLRDIEYPTIKANESVIDKIQDVPDGAYVGLKFVDEVASEELIKNARKNLEDRGCIWLGITRPQSKRTNNSKTEDVKQIEGESISDTFIYFYTQQNKGKGPKDEVKEILKFIDDLNPESITADSLDKSKPNYTREYADKIINELMRIIGG